MGAAAAHPSGLTRPAVRSSRRLGVRVLGPARTGAAESLEEKVDQKFPRRLLRKARWNFCGADTPEHLQGASDSQIRGNSPCWISHPNTGAPSVGGAECISPEIR